MTASEERGKRLRLVTMLLLVIAGGLPLLSAVMTWGEVTIPSLGQQYSATGSQANGSLVALGLATLAAAGALTISGRALRYVLGVLAVALGACLIASGIFGGNDEVSWFIDEVADASGQGSTGAVREVIATGSLTTYPIWSGLVVVAGVIAIGGGLLALLTGRTWPVGGRRYSTTAVAADDDHREADLAVDQWDALSHGDDPTDPAAPSPSDIAPR